MKWIALAIVFAISWGIDAAAQMPQDNSGKGAWIADKSGCRVWDFNPQPNETIVYTGACLNGVASGHGIVEWYVSGKLGQRTEGDRIEGHLNGWASIQNIYDGSHFEGEFRDDVKNGTGTYTYSNGNRYQGDWKDGQRTGKGVLTFTDGGRYDGEFKNGKYEGHGVRIWASGNKYDGQWHDGKAHGEGTLSGTSGQVVSGQWVDGCLRGRFNQLSAWAGVEWPDCK